MTKAKINKAEVELPDGQTLADVARAQQLPERGVAIAVNNDIVARGDWGSRPVREGDDIVIVKAFCGG